MSSMLADSMSSGVPALPSLDDTKSITPRWAQLFSEAHISYTWKGWQLWLQSKAQRESTA